MAKKETVFRAFCPPAFRVQCNLTICGKTTLLRCHKSQDATVLQDYLLYEEQYLKGLHHARLSEIDLNIFLFQFELRWYL